MWYIFALASLFAALSCFGLSILVYLRNTKSVLNRRFAVVGILIGWWSLFPLVTDLASTTEQALQLGRLTYLAAIFVPPTFFHFVFVFLGIYEKRINRTIAHALYGISFLLLLFVFSPLLIQSVVPRAPNSFVVPGPLYPVLIIFFVSLIPYAFYHIYTAARSTVGYRGEQLKFLLLGFFFALFGGALHMLVPYLPVNIEQVPHDLLLILWIITISYAIVRYRLLDIRIALTRIALFVFVYSVLLGIPFYLGFRTGFNVGVTILVAVLASIGPLVYQSLTTKAEDLLLAQQRRYQEILLQASNGIMKEWNTERLVKIIVYLIKRTVKVRFAAAFLDDKEAGEFRLIKAARNGQCQGFPTSFPYAHPLVAYMTAGKRPFSFDEMSIEAQSLFDPDGLGMLLVVPAVIDDKLVGFIVLGNKLDRSPYTQADINVFKTLLNHLSIAGKVKELQDEVKRTERLSMMGQMANILAHEIKNPLSAIKNSVYLLKRSVARSPEAEALVHKPVDIIDKELVAMQYIIDNMLDFARTRRPVTSVEDLREVARSVLDITMFPPNVALQAEMPDSIPANVDVEEMRQVLRNLVNNAVDSMREKPIGTLRVRLMKDAAKKAAVLEIADCGCGIPEEHLKKIFDPFFSTKSKGTGLGLSVVKKIVEERHRGTIDVASVVGTGTTFTLRIPAA